MLDNCKILSRSIKVATNSLWKWFASNKLSTPALNSLIGIQSESKLSADRSVHLTQLSVADVKWVHHDAQLRFVRMFSEADLHDPLPNSCSSRETVRRGSGSLDLNESPSTKKIMCNGLLDESLEEDFDIPISIGFRALENLRKKSWQSVEPMEVRGLLSLEEGLRIGPVIGYIEVLDWL